MHAYLVGWSEKEPAHNSKNIRSFKNNTHVQIHLLVSYLSNEVKTVLKYRVENVNRKTEDKTSILLSSWTVEKRNELKDSNDRNSQLTEGGWSHRAVLLLCELE